MTFCNDTVTVLPTRETWLHELKTGNRHCFFCSLTNEITSYSALLRPESPKTPSARNGAAAARQGPGRRTAPARPRPGRCQRFALGFFCQTTGFCPSHDQQERSSNTRLPAHRLQRTRQPRGPNPPGPGQAGAERAPGPPPPP